MKFITALLISLFVCTSLFAEETKVWPHNLAGVYKRQFKNTSIDVPSYTSEDILELVSIDPARLYIRTELPAENGHRCSLSGWLTTKDALTLVYHPAIEPAEQTHASNQLVEACEMLLHVRDGKIVFDPQQSNCGYRNCCDASYCGARATIYHTEFKLSTKRPIRYMQRLKNSDQYQQVLKAVEAETSENR